MHLLSKAFGSKGAFTRSSATLLLLSLGATSSLTPALAQAGQQPLPAAPNLSVDRDPAPSPDPDPAPVPAGSPQAAPIGSISKGTGGKYTLRQDAYEVRLNASVFDQSG